jgi:outer membrane immunogenic protein
MKDMRYLLAMIAAAAAAIVLTGSEACAADMAARPIFTPPPPPVNTWTGFYAGLDGGFGGNEFQYPTTAGGLAGTASLHSSGFFGGGQVGYNWQFSPNWLVGLEADINAADIDGSANASTGFAAASAGTRLDWFGTVRGRLGYVVTPNTLVYATGGWAYGHTTTSANASLTGVTGTSVSTGVNQNSGWTVGGGIEYAVNQWLSVKTEYAYVDLGTANLFTGSVGGVPLTLGEKATFHTVKAGLNFKLGGWGSAWNAY